ncbi:MAG: glycosyltransferase family 9 protein [Chloroherpetonaceae bacterium]|nr:glycosyltransferase family 9 protein [Chloroherpetonaceae bacterium]
MTEPARILIIRLSSIGDIVLATPLVRQVRTRFPHATIDFLTKPAFAELLAHNSHLSHLFTTENFTSAYRYDLCIDLQNNWRSYRLRHRLASKTFVYRKQNWRKFLLVAFKWRWQLDTRPVPLRYLSACAPLGLVDDGKGCELFLSDAHRAFAQRSLAALPTLAVCYGAKHFTKRFPLEKLARVLNALQQAEPLLQVVLLGGREDAVLGQMLTQQLTPSPLVKNFSGQCSLLESAALIERADAVLTNDTGLMHIAAAFQKRLVVLFGSSVREFGFLPFRAPFRADRKPCGNMFNRARILGVLTVQRGTLGV